MAELAPPVVRAFLLCEDVLIEGPRRTQVSLIRLLHSIRSLDDPRFPHCRGLLSAFVQLTGCRGDGELRVEIRRDETDEIIYRTESRRMQFENDPLRVQGAVFRMVACVFPAAGLYWIQLMWNGAPLAQQQLTLR